LVIGVEGSSRDDALLGMGNRKILGWDEMVVYVISVWEILGLEQQARSEAW
jgi:hypothetical protein